MADVERSCCGANNNIGVVPHGLSGLTSPITDGEVLIESEFLELNSQLHYSKTVHILLTDEFVFVKETRDRRDSEAHVLQYESGKTVTKFLRSDVTIEVCDGCPFTFKAKWNKDTLIWKTYELCGKEEVWPKWLRSFNAGEPQGLELIPSTAICEVSGDSDSDDCSDGDDGEDVQIPEYMPTLPLSVDRTISTWSVAMFNPSKVRRLAITQYHRPVLPSLTSSNASDFEDMFDNLNAGSLYRSNSHPRLSLAKPFRCPSLLNVGDLENVRVDADLRIRECRTRGESTADDACLKLSSSALFNREGENPDKNLALASLQQRVENLRAHPSNLNFVRSGKGELTTPKHHRKHSLCLAMGNEANRIPMPSDFGSGVVRRSPVLHNKQYTAKENRKTASTHDTRTRDSSLSPKKQLSKRSDSLLSSKRPDFADGTPSISEGENKTPAARCFEFKDDMAVTLSESDQPQRKEKLRRFWSVLYKKRPKLRMQAADSDDSLKENDASIRNNEGNLSSVKDTDVPNGVVGGTRRGGFSGSFAASKRLSSTKEEVVMSPLQSKQGRWNGVQFQCDQFLNSHCYIQV